ncbi:MAG TPA: putative sulfate exporter family transporter, partial [Candidatus Bilophila faecipullorum]|nr:putative sulfate exporter family transporter [Candidatus Bilophila faecipullorum]
RVIMIAPLLICLGFWLNRFPEDQPEEASRVPSYGTYNFSTFPWFAILFIVCIGINSLGIIPHQAVSIINSLDIFMLTMAMCALGMETSLEKVRTVGPKPFLLAGVLALWLLGGGYFVTRFILSLNL